MAITSEVCMMHAGSWHKLSCCVPLRFCSCLCAGACFHPDMHIRTCLCGCVAWCVSMSLRILSCSLSLPSICKLTYVHTVIDGCCGWWSMLMPNLISFIFYWGHKVKWWWWWWGGGRTAWTVHVPLNSPLTGQLQPVDKRYYTRLLF